MYIEIITVEKKLYEGEIDLVQVPGSKGSFEVLKNHASLISTLDQGNIKVVDIEGNKEFFKIESGVIEVSNNKIVVLAEVV